MALFGIIINFETPSALNDIKFIVLIYPMINFVSKSVRVLNFQNSFHWNLTLSSLENRSLNRKSEKMIIFKTIQNKFLNLGITPQQKYALNVQSISILLVFGLGIISTSVYVCSGVRSFDEYVACSYECSVISLGFLGIANCIWNTSKLYRLLNTLENTINESETRHSMCFLNALTCCEFFLQGS